MIDVVLEYIGCVFSSIIRRYWFDYSDVLIFIWKAMKLLDVYFSILADGLPLSAHFKSLESFKRLTRILQCISDEISGKIIDESHQVTCTSETFYVIGPNSSRWMSSVLFLVFDRAILSTRDRWLFPRIHPSHLNPEFELIFISCTTPCLIFQLLPPKKVHNGWAWFWPSVVRVGLSHKNLL